MCVDLLNNLVWAVRHVWVSVGHSKVSQWNHGLVLLCVANILHRLITEQNQLSYQLRTNILSSKRPESYAKQAER